MRVLVFGDSITFGAWDSQGGWVDRIKRDYIVDFQRNATRDSPNPHQIVNLGVGGETSQGLLARLENEYKARQSANWPPAFVIATGTNDSRRVVATGKQQVDPQQYKDNLRQIIKLSQSYSDKLLLVGLFPLAEEELPFKDTHYSQKMIHTYDEAMSEVADELSVPKVEILRPILDAGSHQSLLFADGLHPNDAGHQAIYDLVAPQLKSLLVGD